MAQAVTVDSTGSVVVAGFSTTQISLGDPQMKMVPPGLFVVKLDGAGNVAWSNGFGALGCGGTKDSAISSMTVTSGNDVVIAGRYCGSIDFGDGAIPSQMASQDGFVALLGGGTGLANSGNGWNKVFGDGSQQRAIGVTAGGPFGEITLVGDFGGVAQFGNAGSTITSAGGDDLFVTKLLADGTPTSAARFGDSDDQYATAMTTDATGNLYISGTFKGVLSFGGGGSVTAQKSNSNVYLVKFDSLTNHQWSKTFGSDNLSFSATTDISIDGSSNIFLAGIFLGSIDIGAGPIVSKGANSDVFLAKLAPNGNPLWGRSFDDGPGVLFGRMKLSPAMEPILAGFASSSTNFGTGPLAPVGSNDGFVAKFAQ
jgi:hypothetical protein